MKRLVRLCCGVALALSLTPVSFAQMGMDLFKKPSITKAFNPVVGKGAVYETTEKKDGTTRTMELTVVGKEAVEGKDGFWMEFYTERNGQKTVGKSLITAGDFQFHRLIVQPPGQQAMELPASFSEKRAKAIEDSSNEWHAVGTETITVPAGTFSCEHWRNDKRNSDIWTSDKVTPFGGVKEVNPDSTMVLVKVLSDVQDRITGPVKAFDMQQMMQQMQQKRQQPNP